MEFTEKERLQLERTCKWTRARVSNILDDPGRIFLEEGKEQHIWDRLYALSAMNDEELMREIETDYRIFGEAAIKKD